MVQLGGGTQEIVVNLDELYRLMRVAHVQAQGIVDTVREPLLVLTRDLCVEAASRSFYDVFQVGREETIGRHLYELGNGQWDIPDLRLLLEKVIPRSRGVEGYEVEHVFPHLGRRVMLLNARKLFHPDSNSQTLLLAIEDVTDIRQHEDNQSIRMGELQHRMKNLLAMVSALARQTRTAGRSADEYRDTFLGRFSALVHAHEMAFQQTDSADLATLILPLLEPYAQSWGR